MSRLRAARVFLIADLEYTIRQKLRLREVFGIIINFYGELGSKSCFDKNPVFAVRKQLHRFRTKPTPDSDLPWSKVLPAIWNNVFCRMYATPFL